MWWQCYVSQIRTTPICLGWRWSITDVREGQQGEINVTKVGDEVKERFSARGYNQLFSFRVQAGELWAEMSFPGRRNSRKYVIFSLSKEFSVPPIPLPELFRNISPLGAWS